MTKALKSLVVTGAILGALVPVAITNASASSLRYQSGYSIQGRWLCYGWSDGIYHCTRHWYRRQGRVVSTNPAWVPNVGRRSVRSQKQIQRASNGGGTAGGSVVGLIDAAFGADAWAAIRVGECESGLSPGAYNPSSGAAGVFQFLPSTWASTPYAGDSPFNAWANVNAAAWMVRQSGWSAWVCKP